MTSKHSIHTPEVKQSHSKIKVGHLIIYGVIILAVVFGVSYFAFTPRNTGESLIGTPISENISSQLSGVSYNTLNSVDKSSVIQLTKVSGRPLIDNGKPVVLYVGADYCPFCASERWALVVALSKFGNFTGLTYMMSSPSDVYANTPTMSFEKITYTSDYITFQAVETSDRSGNPLQSTTTEQKLLMQLYDSTGGIPFVDIANNYVIAGSQFQPSTFQGMSWAQISANLDNPKSQVGKSVDASAATLITAICKSLDTKPAVCNEKFAN